jgi:hypothetical protein
MENRPLLPWLGGKSIPRPVPRLARQSPKDVFPPPLRVDGVKILKTLIPALRKLSPASPNKCPRVPWMVPPGLGRE